MCRTTPRTTRSDTLFPNTTLFRSWYIAARDFHDLLISQIVAQLHHDGSKCLALDRDADLTNSFNEFDNIISQQGVDGISHTFVGGIFGCGTAHISVRSFQCDEFSVGAASRRKEALLL